MLVVQDLPPPGLREQKRHETRLALETAAVDLALEHGLDSVTVEQIAERAHVSARTFFNYFTSKEEAFLGESVGLPDEEAVRRFTDEPSGDGLFKDMQRLLLDHVEPLLRGKGLFKRRAQALASHPQLAVRHLNQSVAAVDAVTHQVARRIEAELGSDAQEPSEEALAEARMLVHICDAVLRASFRADSLDFDAEETVNAIKASFEVLNRVKERYL